jgi:hypothetical protein
MTKHQAPTKRTLPKRDETKPGEGEIWYEQHATLQLLPFPFPLSIFLLFVFCFEILILFFEICKLAFGVDTWK